MVKISKPKCEATESESRMDGATRLEFNLDCYTVNVTIYLFTQVKFKIDLFSVVAANQKQKPFVSSLYPILH